METGDILNGCGDEIIKDALVLFAFIITKASVLCGQLLNGPQFKFQSLSLSNFDESGEPPRISEEA